jgi:hypothetical protein
MAEQQLGVGNSEVLSASQMFASQMITNNPVFPFCMPPLPPTPYKNPMTEAEKLQSKLEKLSSIIVDEVDICGLLIDF